MRIKMAENCLVLEVCFYTPRSENAIRSVGLLTNMKGFICVTNSLDHLGSPELSEI